MIAQINVLVTLTLLLVTITLSVVKLFEDDITRRLLIPNSRVLKNISLWFLVSDKRPLGRRHIRDTYAVKSSEIVNRTAEFRGGLTNPSGGNLTRSNLIRDKMFYMFIRLPLIQFCKL